MSPQTGIRTVERVGEDKGTAEHAASSVASDHLPMPCAGLVANVHSGRYARLRPPMPGFSPPMILRQVQPAIDQRLAESAGIGRRKTPTWLFNAPAPPCR